MSNCNDLERAAREVVDAVKAWTVCADHDKMHPAGAGEIIPKARKLDAALDESEGRDYPTVGGGFCAGCENEVQNVGHKKDCPHNPNEGGGRERDQPDVNRDDASGRNFRDRAMRGLTEDEAEVYRGIRERLFFGEDAELPTYPADGSGLLDRAIRASSDIRAREISSRGVTYRQGMAEMLSFIREVSDE